MEMKIRILLLSALVIATNVLVSGCAALTQVRFTVDPSALDYVQLRRVLPPIGNEKSIVIRLELAGSGYLDYRSGRSVRVRDNFWQESNAPDWQDLQTDHLVLTQEETRIVYQRFVDAGLFDHNQKPPPDGYNLAIMGCIGFEKRALFTNDPVYSVLFEELLAKFRY
jgi:hypothetical protein